ncbi:restriction endonuclease [Aureibaculum sp. 2210JD6-5]|uniref:restriction endonuclease n=1 Tax=Aureibaculum sp. 2210JD6-5 TaxID=3103957 RepID=UPI002AAD9EDC|nr:restriction endonuclease [Aureibaculum sp. 2210JD6-5]MDY7396675.1 restriction endonuclease [Aureibaculum sp. 2210JD6-5]
MKNKKLWMVRAGESAYLIDDFLEKSIIAIGWNAIGKLSKTNELNQIKDKLRKSYPNSKPSQINNFAGQIYRFRVEFDKGQNVITYNPTKRIYHLGEITSDYKYSETKMEFFHFREVKWIKEINRDSLSTKTKNTLGSTLTIFNIANSAKDEILGNKVKSAKTSEIQTKDDEDETLDTIKEEIEEKAHEFIKDKLQQLDWEEMQELVAGILRGMGYKTTVSPRGADRGKDIMASPDGLGLENPKIKVEVKHRTGSMGSSDVRNFIGGLRPNDKGLYVSSGGFTKEAKYEAERANVPLTLIDNDRLVNLIIQHYDQFDPETRALMPLKKIYWPI